MKWHENGKKRVSEPQSQPVPIKDTLEDEHVPDPDVPDPTAENNALADINRALKWKLKEAVALANGCYRALERERMLSHSILEN